MPVVVELPDGSEVEFPDGMTDDQMAEAIRSNFPQFAPADAQAPAAALPAEAAGPKQPTGRGFSARPTQRPEPELLAGVAPDHPLAAQFRREALDRQSIRPGAPGSEEAMLTQLAAQSRPRPEIGPAPEQAAGMEALRGVGQAIQRSGVVGKGSAAEALGGQLLDTAGSVAKAVPAGVAFAARVGNLLTLGDDDSAWMRLAKEADRFADAGSQSQSLGLRTQRANLASAKGLTAALQAVAANPLAVLDMAVESGGGSVAVAGGIAKLGGVAAVAIAKRNGATGARALERAYRTGAEWGAGAGNVLLNAGDSFDQVKGDLLDRLNAAVVTGLGSAVTSKVTKGGAEGALAGQRGDGIRALVREPVQEIGESLSQSVGVAAGEQRAVDLDQAAGDAVVSAAAGVPVGAMAAMADRPAPGRISPPAPVPTPRVEDQPSTPLAPEQIAALAGEAAAAKAVQPGQAPVAPVVDVDKSGAAPADPAAVAPAPIPQMPSTPAAAVDLNDAGAVLGRLGFGAPPAATPAAPTPAPAPEPVAPAGAQTIPQGDLLGRAQAQVSQPAPDVKPAQKPADQPSAPTVYRSRGQAMAQAVNQRMVDVAPAQTDKGWVLRREQDQGGSDSPEGAGGPQPTPAPAADPFYGEEIDQDWQRFGDDSGTKSVPRADMPQIKAEHRGAMTQFLSARGIAHEQTEVAAGELKPTQAEFSREKVEQAKTFEGGDRSILVSSDGHVLDGHHQWIAAREQGRPVKVIRLDAPIDQLLEVVKEFPSAQAGEGAVAPEKNDQEARFSRVDELPEVTVGPGGAIRPRPIATGAPLYRETNLSGLDDLLRQDGQPQVSRMFVADNRDIAIGQGENRGVMVTFRPDSLSGGEHRKPGTGDAAGREYQTDLMAPRAVQSIEMSAADARKARGLTKRALEDFDRTDLGDGRVRFDRKGLSADTPGAAVGGEPNEIEAESRTARDDEPPAAPKVPEPRQAAPRDPSTSLAQVARDDYKALNGRSVRLEAESGQVTVDAAVLARAIDSRRQELRKLMDCMR